MWTYQMAFLKIETEDIWKEFGRTYARALVTIDGWYVDEITFEDVGTEKDFIEACVQYIKSPLYEKAKSLFYAHA